MKKCAFLTMDELQGFVSDDELAVEPLARLGWQVQFIPWRQTAVPWSTFDLVVIRTTWDYQNDLPKFLAVLEEIGRVTRLVNDIRIVRWNVHKGYLQDLQEQGIGIVPTWWGSDLNGGQLRGLCQTFQCRELVIKPAVGANADLTYRLKEAEIETRANELRDRFRNKPFMVQPFMPAIVEEGEYSLFFFAGAYSHAILKSPQAEDFRVQEEHGGVMRAVDPEERLLQRAKAAVTAVSPKPLYARVDMVRAPGGDFLVMELELVEPSLYLRMDPTAPDRFAAAVAFWGRR